MVQTIWAVRGQTDSNLLQDSFKDVGAGPRASEGQPQGVAPTYQGSSLFLKLLFHRGLHSEDAIERFLFPRREDLLNPFLMKGMSEAVERLRKAALRGEKVLIHGDYDVDGITGAAILSLTLTKLGISHETFLPERKKDGYGVSREAIEKAAKDGTRLLVTVDCGISAGAEIREAREAGIEAIVLDHHRLPPEGLPPAHAILNPLQENCAYPFKELSAGGLAFKLAQALLGQEASEYFDLATLSTVADLAPLRGENRILVQEGLHQLSERRRTGIKALTQAASLRAREIKTSHVGFMMGPRINASGRMSSALTALRLLLTTNEREAQSLAQILEVENRQRQQEERKVLSEALGAAERIHNFTRDRILVVAQEGWHAGVIGIVASRLVERYHRPALVIALENGRGKGSGRSIRSFHLFNALDAAREFFIEFGGHEQAAGFSIEADKIASLRKKLNEHAHLAYPAEVFLKSIDIDLEISLADLTPCFVKELELLEPFGIGNPKPVFLTRGLFVRNVGAGPRKRVWVTDGTLTYEATISERSDIPFYFEPGSRFDLVYTVGRKSWDGETVTVLEAKDAKPPA